MKTENASVPAVARYAKPGEIGGSQSRQAAAGAAALAGAAQSGMRPIAADERRRGQRVLLRVRAQIHVALEGQATTFDVHTLNVNPHGALVVMNKFLASGTRLVLENLSTREKVPCRVARPPRESAEGFQASLEFDSPSPRFWRIAFPPTDWRPEE